MKTPKRLQQMNEAQKRWASKNPDYVRAYAKEYRARSSVKKRQAQYMREYALKMKYGLTPEQFEALIDAQAGCCAICGREFHKLPYIDHDHDTGYVRGLLCAACNSGLGHFKDDTDRLMSAARYLEACRDKLVHDLTG